MSEIVDRIATELFDKFASDDGSPCCLYSDDICRKIVRAVIAAMREPTEGMARATGDDYAYSHAKDTYRAMIDEALKE